MNEKLVRYLETYKRLFFRGQINNPKSLAILQQKRISLGLSEDEVENASNELSNKFDALINFIENILEFSGFDIENKSIDSGDREEIVEFWRDLNLSDDDGNKILELIINKFTNNSRERKL